MSYFDENEDRLTGIAGPRNRHTWGSQEGPSRFTPTPEHPNHGKPWTAVQEGQLKKYAAQGLGISEIAKRMGRYPSAIELRLEKLGFDPTANADLTPGKHLISHTEYLKEQKYVNMNHILTMLQTNYTTVNVSYSPGVPTQHYTYKVSNELAGKLEPGTPVVVDASGSLKVAYITEVHDEPLINIHAPYALKWVICKVDRSHYDEQVKRETEAAAFLEKSERQQAQQKAMAALLELVPNVDELRKLLNG